MLNQRPHLCMFKKPNTGKFNLTESPYIAYTMKMC